MKVNLKEQTLRKAGLRIIDIIRQKTKKTLDYRDEPLAKYCPQYRIWKEKKYPQYKGKVNLTMTGNMLRSLVVILAGDNTIRIGFENEEASQLAYYHNISGAGRGRVLRRFLGISDEGLIDEKLYQILAAGVIVET